MATIRAAQAAGTSALVKFGERTIQFEPRAPFSGMTNFVEKGFVIGREAFASGAELTKTVRHELYRLSFSAHPLGGAPNEAVRAETEAAFNLANRAFNVFFGN